MAYIMTKVPASSRKFHQSENTQQDYNTVFDVGPLVQQGMPSNATKKMNNTFFEKGCSRGAATGHGGQELWRACEPRTVI
jgi:hypothetical protein